jgi:hypothetical protein
MLGNKRHLFFAFCAVAALGLVCSTTARANLVLATASLNGSQEVPPVPNSALGVAILNVDTTSELFDFSLFVSGINTSQLMGVGPNSSPIHLHSAPVGVNGPIVVDVGFLGSITPLGTLGFKLDVVGATFGGVQGALSGPSPATNIADLLSGDLYVNVHTMTSPGGQIRGQLVPAVVPEPATLALAVCAAVGVGALSLRRRYTAES